MTDREQALSWISALTTFLSCRAEKIGDSLTEFYEALLDFWKCDKENIGSWRLAWPHLCASLRR